MGLKNNTMNTTMLFLATSWLALVSGAGALQFQPQPAMQRPALFRINPVLR